MYDKFQTLVTDASIAVEVLINADSTDVEFLPSRPTHLGAEKIYELARLWEFRGLRWIGTLGVVNGCARFALAEPVESQQLFALASAFAAYCHVLGFGIDEQIGDEAAWLERLHSLEDNRPEA